MARELEQIRSEYEAKAQEASDYLERLRDTTTRAAGPMQRKALRLEAERDALARKLREREG